MKKVLSLITVMFFLLLPALSWSLLPDRVLTSQVLSEFPFPVMPVSTVASLPAMVPC